MITARRNEMSKTKCMVCGAPNYTKPPHEEIKGTVPLVMYFGSEKDRDEFVAVIRKELPGLEPYKADQ